MYVPLTQLDVSKQSSLLVLYFMLQIGDTCMMYTGQITMKGKLFILCTKLCCSSIKSSSYNKGYS